MERVEGIYGGVDGGGYARVLLEVKLLASGSVSRVEVGLDQDDEWNQQLLRGKWDDWLDGAAYGVRFALDVAQVTAEVRVRRIVGLLVDTNPTNIAAAAADAVWKAVRFEAPATLKERMQQAVAESWETGRTGVVSFSVKAERAT